MRLSTRRLLDRAFTGVGLFSILLMGLALLFILGPIFSKGASALVFRQTVEHRRFLLDKLQRGSPEELADEMRLVQEARQPIYAYMAALDDKITSGPRTERRQYRVYQEPLNELKKLVRELLGPLPGESVPLMTGEQYGQTRWERAQKKAQQILYIEEYDYSDPSKMGVKVLKPRVEQFRATPVEPLFEYVNKHLEEMLRPQWTFYGGFLFDMPFDSYMLGGIWPSILGTFYLTLGAMFLAAPLGIVAAVYFVEYGDENFLSSQLFSLIPRGKASIGESSNSLRDKTFKVAIQIERNMVSMLRICVSTLAGVPSIVFGLFGLAFLIHTIHLSDTKSVLAGSATLALLILPTIIRASEEAIRAVPLSYREAAVGLGASKWRTIWTVILPAALPGILTGTIISMGRAAGETAPIIFTAAVSLGAPLSPLQALSQPTPALPWSIYVLSTEHAALDQIRHVQYGMVFVLILLVLGLNLTAILLRARIARKLKRLIMQATLEQPIAMQAPVSYRTEALATTSTQTDVAGKAVIAAENFFIYYGTHAAVREVTIQIPPGKVTAIIGPSGCGKSTFLRAINRMNDLIPSCRTAGLLSLDGVDIYAPRLDVVSLRRRVGMVFQKPNPFPKSIFDNIAYGPRLFGVRNRQVLEEIVEKSLRRAALWDEVKDRLNANALGFSGGQQQRLCIARALAVDPEVLLMDEPASALDPRSTARIEDLIGELRGAYTIVIVTHNMQQAARVSDHTAFFYEGELVEFGATRKLFTKPEKKATEDYITGRFG